MNDPRFDFDQQAEVLARFERLMSHAAAVESTIVAEYQRDAAAANADHQAAKAALAAAYDKGRAELEAEYENMREAAMFDFETDMLDRVQKNDRRVKRYGDEKASEMEKATKSHKKLQLGIETGYAAARARSKQELQANIQQIKARRAELDSVAQEALALMTRRRCPIPADTAESAKTPAGDASSEPNPLSRLPSAGSASQHGAPQHEDGGEVAGNNLIGNGVAVRDEAELAESLSGEVSPPPIVHPPDVHGANAEQTPLDRYEAALQEARRLLRKLESHGPAHFLDQHWPLLIFIFTWIGAAYPLAAYFQFNFVIWPAATTGAALAAALLARSVVRPFVVRNARRLYPQVIAEFPKGNLALDQALGNARIERVERDALADRQRFEAIQKEREAYKAKQHEIEQRHRQQMEEESQSFAARRTELLGTRDRRLGEADAWLPAQHDPLTADYLDRVERFECEFRAATEERERAFRQRWNELVENWRVGSTEFQSAVDAAAEFRADRFPAWGESVWDSYRPRADEPPIIPFGDHRYDVDATAEVQPKDDALRLNRRRFDLPAALRLPERPSLLLEADGAGRDLAVQSMQNVMLRMLTSLPPGKVRFTIIDPVGLGQNFSAFMHLADFDEKLVASRIWTETSHIQKRLSDLTEHMENVIQKYLRNEFASIHDYNRQAGEVAEPFQILVIANFPAGFNDEAAQRLTSIASSGARCGVYSLISVDTKLRLPRNFDLADLERWAITLKWDGVAERFCAEHPRLSGLPLELEPPPAEERFTSIVRDVGRLAKDASRVEVPFASISAAPNEWWSMDSRRSVDVPLGRAGATKLQYMRLGSGTSQHVLIAGKTGSGKSTMLNALIVNLSIWYSPEEIQFFLIDFKKGVEFKPYATHALPHARVIAIESEREFGMSVLEKLDLELRERGDLFRSRGVQNLAAFRDAHPDEPMPRLMLIIDEFQEFFVKEDKIAAESALLLDRLVRQGRAFGIHVLLGSQTLSGAYSLARSTLGQMAVRVALQCSESDAHLILSDENTAARLLGRPGEAIYNDANGLLEGNHPFQIAWLPDEEREHLLQRLQELARIRAPHIEPPIIFEGNQPADPRENRRLVELFASGPNEAALLAPRVWLGAAVSIKEPTSIAFRRQGGANLLVVGAQEELAVGTLANSILCLAGQSASLAVGAEGAAANESSAEVSSERDAAEDGSTSATFVVLDGLRPESSVAGCWRRLAEQFPASMSVATGRDALQSVAQLADEVARRTESCDESAPPKFLVVANLSRFRELQRGEDFGFSSFGDEEKPDPGKQFRSILRDGPSVGVHTLIWADSFNSSTRWLDRQTMQDLDFRVLFQMGASDSSNLMDSTAAANLGPYRAILYRHEMGEHEKFRPYAFPEREWIEQIAARVKDRGPANVG